MRPADKIAAGNIEVRVLPEAGLDCSLAVDMSEAFFLQVTPGRIAGIILTHGPFNIDKVGAVSFNEVGIVAVDELQEFDDCLLRDRVQLAAKGG